MTQGKQEEVKLGAIMFTDIAGYSSLTEKDETAALELLSEHRGVIRPLISKHGGREVKTMGDAFLVEFGSASEATICARDIQIELHDSNLTKAVDRRIFLRIGIHLGDVVHSLDDVYGDAVNVASRIQTLAEKEGVCITAQVYESVRKKLKDYKFESLGRRSLKNVETSLEVFKVVMPWESKEDETGLDIGQKKYNFPRDRVAVLPFVNISPDVSDEYFADGLTEELISRLSQTKELRVIARTSAMNYKNNREKKIREIGKELGAGTVVEGSVRKAGNKVRVSVQVVNAGTEEHLWSSTYDRSLDDIFEIQTDIATKVAESFSSKLAQLVSKEVSGEGAVDVTAYTYYLRGRHFLHNEDEPSTKKAMEFFERAIEADTSLAKAYVGRAECFLSLSGFGAIPFLEGSRKAEEDIEKALQLEPDLPDAHAVLSHVKYTLDDFTAGEEQARKAIEINPSQADAYHMLAHLAIVRGNLSEAARLTETARRLDPLSERNIEMLGMVYTYLGRTQEALELYRNSEHLFPIASCSGMIEYYLIAGDYSNAKKEFEKFKLLMGSESPMALGMEGVIAGMTGDREKALECISKIESSWTKETVTMNYLAMIYYTLKDMDRFFEYLNRAQDIHALALDNLRNSPLFTDARRDERFLKLLERAGIQKRD